MVALQDLLCFLQCTVDSPEALLGTKVFQGVPEPAQGCLRMKREKSVKGRAGKLLDKDVEQTLPYV